MQIYVRYKTFLVLYVSLYLILTVYIMTALHIPNTQFWSMKKISIKNEIKHYHAF